MKFNNLNLGHAVKAPEFTGKDVKSESVIKTEEKIDYADSDIVGTLGKKVNAFEAVNTAFNLKFIPREKIQFNKNNDFNIVDIEELAESLLSIGMQHNLGAVYDEEHDFYVLESGERRLRACDLLHDKYGLKNGNNNDEEYQQYKEYIKPFYDKGFPVNVKKEKHQEEDETHQKLDYIDSELRKYKVNIDVRDFTPQERAKYIQKVRTLIEERNQILYGNDAPLPTKAEVAMAVGTSERQLRKYDALDHLIPALRQEFESGNISINKVPSIASLPEEEQMIFLDLLQRGKSIEPTQIKIYQEHMKSSEEARKKAEEEKAKIEDELEHIRASKDNEISEILEKSRERELEIRQQIEKAERDKNEDAILRLQNDLARERESSGRLISEANKSLESTKAALAEANKKLETYKSMSQSEDALIRMNAELAAQVMLTVESVKKSMQLIQKIGTDRESIYRLLKRDEAALLKEFLELFER